jgi:hypothetical protein
MVIHKHVESSKKFKSPHMRVPRRSRTGIALLSYKLLMLYLVPSFHIIGLFIGDFAVKMFPKHSAQVL